MNDLSSTIDPGGMFGRVYAEKRRERERRAWMAKAASRREAQLAREFQRFVGQSPATRLGRSGQLATRRAKHDHWGQLT